MKREFLNILLVRFCSFIENSATKAGVDVFLELSHFFDDLVDVGNLISGSSAFSKPSLNIGKFTFHVGGGGGQCFFVLI